MTIQSTITEETQPDGVFWRAEATTIHQEFRDVDPVEFHVQAAGERGDHAGVLLANEFLTVVTARELAEALLRHADIAEAQAVAEVTRCTPVFSEAAVR